MASMSLPGLSKRSGAMLIETFNYRRANEIETWDDPGS